MDRPGALHAAYLDDQRGANMSATLVFRTVGAALYHTGRYFDPRCHFTRPIMAFDKQLYRFDEAKEIRNCVLTPVEMEALRPTEQDIAQEERDNGWAYGI